jgi:hypothetical protein
MATTPPFAEREELLWYGCHGYTYVSRAGAALRTLPWRLRVPWSSSMPLCHFGGVPIPVSCASVAGGARKTRLSTPMSDYKVWLTSSPCSCWPEAREALAVHMTVGR